MADEVTAMNVPEGTNMRHFTVTADVTNFIRRYAHVNHVEVCECPRIRCECMRISPRICGSSRECARISVNLFANVRVSPANLRGPSANVRECARMCANVRESANVRECGANVRESARMCANAAVYLRECVANVCECSRECLRMFAYLSRMFANACRICGWNWSRQPWVRVRLRDSSRSITCVFS